MFRSKNCNTGDHLFIAFVKFSEKLTFPTPLRRTRTCAYQGVRYVSFSENSANLINEISPVDWAISGKCSAKYQIFWAYFSNENTGLIDF